MYEQSDTIVAISSPGRQRGVIVRISGPEAVRNAEKIFNPVQKNARTPGVYQGCVALDEQLGIDGILYLFLPPNSYTAEPVAEIHLFTNSSVSEAILQHLLDNGLRMAQAGEFTARAFLNGRIDLAQAEAVNEIIVSSNRLQLAAAEKLLEGRLNDRIKKTRADLIDFLSLLEASLDFSGEDIEFITRRQGDEKLQAIKHSLEELLSGSINFESTMELPSVGIAGAPNAGKSSLLNCLLGTDRSIVSDRPKTTRDVLSGLWELEHCRCVVFDCAGLVSRPENIIDRLAQEAAVASLKHSDVVIFCLDVSKADWGEDLATWQLIESQITRTALVAVATKRDLLDSKNLQRKLKQLRLCFGFEFNLVSSLKADGTQLLSQCVQDKLLQKISAIQSPGGSARYLDAVQDGIAVNGRHHRDISEAINNIAQAAECLQKQQDEVSAMLVRTACQAVSRLERQAVDDEILDSIFGRFCIGK